MHQSEASIFRNEALEHSIQSKAKSVLPRITTPPVSLCMWGLLVLCIAVIALTCLVQVPVYVNGTGIVLAQNATILVFVPTSSTHPLQLHAGAPVHLQIGIGQTINSTIDQVETGVFSPDAAQKRYGLGEKASQLLTGPSIVATVKAGPALFSPDYEGSIISVQVQVDTTRVLSLLLLQYPQRIISSENGRGAGNLDRLASLSVADGSRSLNRAPGSILFNGEEQHAAD